MDRTDGIGNCSITVHLKQTQQVSGRGILFEACRVGSVNESDGSMTLYWNLGELTNLRPSVPTEHVTGVLSEMLYGRKTSGKMSREGTDPVVERRTAVTGENGTCTFAHLEAGAWLIHASDSSTYGRIEDTLAAVPCYVQEQGAWTGPVYNLDVWPKGEIQSKGKDPVPQVEIPQTEKPQTEKPGKETEQNKTPQTEDGTEKPGKPELVAENPKTKKSSGASPGGTITARSVLSVRTLDDTPVSALLCAFLSCAVIIVWILTRWRKKPKRRRKTCLILAFCAGLFSLAVIRISAGAQETGEGARLIEGEQKLLFVNEAPSAPFLSVAKEVLHAENGSRAPDGDLFGFRLTLDRERAGGVRYRVFQEDGTELVDLTGEGIAHLVPAGSGAGDPVALSTGRDGSFFLRGGQYALFEDVSVGMLWEVEERSEENYERVVPASSGIITGTIERNGSSARFVNRYDPEPDPDYTETTLEITKRILWPEGCVLPERGSFAIRVLVDGKPWRGAAVELTDLCVSSQPAETVTDDDGIFRIRGEERAHIGRIPVGSDLQVEELDDAEDAFFPCGETIWKGEASSRQKITFTNRLASFVVSKTIRSGDPQHNFLFCLLDAQNQPWPHVPYYLADADGTLAAGEVQYTDAQGHFTLHALQKAVFTGVAEGSRYSVIEERILGYRQVLPPGGEGYLGMRVKDGVQNLLFENERTNVRMFLPSAGGGGIGLMILAAAAGMLLCFHGLRRGKGMRNVQKTVMCALALVLLTTRLSWGAGTETESDAMQTGPAVETDCGFPEEDIRDGEDPEREKENRVGPQVLAGPVELNDYFEGLIIDETPGGEADPAMDALGEAGTEAEVLSGEDAFMGSMPEDGVLPGEEAGRNPESLSENLTSEKDTEEKKQEQTEAGYRYENSMPLSELALLPPLVAGAATEVGRGREGLMKGASSTQTALWTCSDYYVGEPDLYTVTKKEDFSLKYQIEFHTSTGLDPGSVQIRVPEALLTDRNRKAVIPSQIGIPKGTPESPVQSLNSPFNWYRDDADSSLVFFNYREIASGTNSAFQILYHPVRILDLTDASAWSLTPSIQVMLRDGSVQTRDMQELSGSIDSGAVLSGSSADPLRKGSVSSLPALYTKEQVKRILGAGLPAYVTEEDGEWLYVVWEIDCQGEYNQPWSLQMDAALSASGTTGSDDSRVVGSITKITGTSEGTGGQQSLIRRYLTQEGSSTITTLTSQDLLPSVKQGLFHLTTTVVTAVRRDSLRDNGSVLGLKADLALTPADGVDAPSLSEASASWTFVDYKWKYKGDIVGITAWTGQKAEDGSISYSGKNTSLSGWVNEYRLSGQTGEAAGAIPMRIVSECRGYSYTHETGGPAAGTYRAGTGYEVTTVDDVVYLACLNQETDSGLQMLGPQDYYYTGIHVKLIDRGMDIYEDRVCAPMTEAECQGADRTTKIWVMYEDSADWELAAQCPFNSSGEMEYTFSKNQLSGKIWRVKVVHNAVDYDSTCTIDSLLCVRPHSLVCDSLLSEVSENGQAYLKTEHLGSVLARSMGGTQDGWFHDFSESHYEDAEPGIGSLTMSLYGIYSMRANSFAEMTYMKKHAKALKTVSRENDPANGCVRLTCRIGAAEGYRIYSEEAARKIMTSDSNLPKPDRREYVIYDLLPEGVQFDPSIPVKAGLVMGAGDQDLVTPSLWNSRDVTVRVDPDDGVCRNWRHTGRERVKLNVSITLEDEQIPRLKGGMWLNGVGVQFGAVCPYRELKRMKNMPNIAAVMPGSGCDDPACQFLGAQSETACDDGVIVPFTGDQARELEAFGADIDSDGVTNLRTVLYALARTEADTAVSLTDGIHLTVKADRDTYGDWDVSAHTGPEDTYTYRIDVTNTSAQPISELVIATHLERAAEERQQAESGRIFDEQTWQGFLETVDTEAVERARIAPVVWLNADPLAPLPEEGHPPDSVLTQENGWVRLEDWNQDMGQARSVAVDLRKKADGGSFTLEMGDNVYLLLHMRAPAIGDEPGQTMAEHAYQCASFYSISQDEPDGDLVQSDAVEVTLEERAALIVEKELSEKTPGEWKKRSFLFRLTRNGEALSLAQYRLEERADDEQTFLPADNTLHTTGRDGTFSLLPGQRAVFENETGGERLSAEEIRSACFEETMREEQTGEGRVQLVENTWHPTLYLTKKVYGAPDGMDLSADVFRVRVSADGKSMQGMPYWTVDRKGGLVEDQVLEEHIIDEDSCVLLHPGEVIALHPGDAECVYEVQEDAACCAEGTNYAGVTCHQSGTLGPEETSITLENAWRWKELVFRKEILHQGAHACDEMFSFRLWKIRDGADAAGFDPEDPSAAAEPAAGIEGSMGAETFQTDADGCFRLACAGKEVILKHLEAQKTYVVQEIDVPEDYRPLNNGLASVSMPLLAQRKTVSLQNEWTKRSLEVSKAVLSGTHVRRTTVFTPGYPGVIQDDAATIKLFSLEKEGMTGFTVTFPVQVNLVGDERILIRSGNQNIDILQGTIEAGTVRTYQGCNSVDILLWGMNEKNLDGFFFFFAPIDETAGTGQDTGASAEPGKRFTFLVELADEEGNLQALRNTPYQTSTGETKMTDASGHFTLASGERALFADIARQGTAWRVIETPDPSFAQAYPAQGSPWSGKLGENGEDISHALFINGQECQGMFRKMFSAAPQDIAAEAYLAEERAKGEGSGLKSVFLIEKRNGSGSFEPMTGSVQVADAAAGTLLECELSGGKICLSEHQTVVLSGTDGQDAWRVTEMPGAYFRKDGMILQSVCIVPGQEGMTEIRTGEAVSDTVFVNELHSFDLQSLVCKTFLSGQTGWERVPDQAELVFLLERYTNGTWKPAEDVGWIQCLHNIPDQAGLHRTGPDGAIRVRREASSGPSSQAGFPVLPIAISGGQVRTELYYAEHEAQEGDLRIREAPDLTDPAFGMMVNCEGNTFVNENDMQNLVVEKQADEESSQPFLFQITQLINGLRIPGRYLACEIRSAQTGEIISQDRTDREGCFRMRGGEQAVFSLAQGTSWEVTEKSTGNWNLASCTMENSIAQPVPTPRGMVFEMARLKHDVTLTAELIAGPLMDPFTGQTLDFTSASLTIPHYVKKGDEILEITKIADGLFSRSSVITSVTIADGIRQIGANAFYACRKIASIRLPETLETIGNYCFSRAAVTEMEFPSSVRNVGTGITGSCSRLTHVIIHQKEEESPFSGYNWAAGHEITVEFTG